jgi:hypothetical protein
MTKHRYYPLALALSILVVGRLLVALLRMVIG